MTTEDLAAAFESGGRPAANRSRRRFVIRAIDRRLGHALIAAASIGSLSDPADLGSLAHRLPALCAADRAEVVVLEAGNLKAAPLRDHAPEARDDSERPNVEIEQIVATGRPAILNPPVQQLIHAMQPPNWLVLPIVAGGITHGGLVLERRTPFTGEDLTVMTVFARLLGERLTSGTRAAEIESQRRELEQLSFSQRQLLQINERLLLNVDPSDVLDLIADALRTLVEYDSLTIYRREGDTLRAVLARDRFADVILGARISADSGITGSVFTRGVPECVNDAHLDPRANLLPGTPREPESLVIVPLRVGHETIGTLNVGRVGESRHFDAAEFERVKLFASQASIALANVDASRALLAQAETDALTGVRNRGAFERDLNRLVGCARDENITLIMLDLDGFKLYNDRFGHPEGDRILRTVGGAIRAIVGDRGYRYGGDEFAVLVVGEPRQAVAMSARLGEAIAAVSFGGREIRATAGWATYPRDAGTSDGLVVAADMALYRAKRRADCIQPILPPRDV